MHEAPSPEQALVEWQQLAEQVNPGPQPDPTLQTPWEHDSGSGVQQPDTHASLPPQSLPKVQRGTLGQLPVLPPMVWTVLPDEVEPLEVTVTCPLVPVPLTDVVRPVVPVDPVVRLDEPVAVDVVPE